MTNTTPFLRLFAVTALLTGTLLVAGCESDNVSKTTTTERSTSMTPPPVVSSSSTTTTHESRP